VHTLVLLTLGAVAIYLVTNIQVRITPGPPVTTLETLKAKHLRRRK
jgi:hypothetical protein